MLLRWFLLVLWLNFCVSFTDNHIFINNDRLLDSVEGLDSLRRNFDVIKDEANRIVDNEFQQLRHRLELSFRQNRKRSVTNRRNVHPLTNSPAELLPAVVQTLRNNSSQSIAVVRAYNETLVILSGKSSLRYNNSHIYKWDESANLLQPLTSISTLGAIDLEAFLLEERLYFIVTLNENSHLRDPFVRKTQLFEVAVNGSVKVVQSFLTVSSTKWKSFQFKGKTYLAQASYLKFKDKKVLNARCYQERLKPSKSVMIYEWHKHGFKKITSIGGSYVTDLEFCEIFGKSFLIVANRKVGNSSRSSLFVYEISLDGPFGIHFKLFQDLPATGPRDIHCFQSENSYFIAVANEYGSSEPQRRYYNVESTIFRFNGLFFAPYQQVKSVGAIKWSEFQLNGPQGRVQFLHLHSLYSDSQQFVYTNNKWMPIMFPVLDKVRQINHLKNDYYVITGSNLAVLHWNQISTPQSSDQQCNNLIQRLNKLSSELDANRNKLKSFLSHFHTAGSRIKSYKDLSVVERHLQHVNSSVLAIANRVATVKAKVLQPTHYVDNLVVDKLVTERLFSNTLDIKIINGVSFNQFVDDVVKIIPYSENRLSLGQHQFKQMRMTGPVTLKGTLNGFAFQRFALLNRPNVFLEPKSIENVIVNGNLIVKGTIDGVSSNDFLLKFGDQNVESKVVIEGDCKAPSLHVQSGIIDGIDWNLITKTAIRINNPRATVIRGNVRFTSDLIVNELFTTGRISGVNITDLNKNALVFTGEKEINASKLKWRNLVVEGDVTIVQSFINGYKFPHQFLRLNDRIWNTPHIIFDNVEANAVHVKGLVNGLDLAKDILTINGTQIIEGRKRFTDIRLTSILTVKDGYYEKPNIHFENLKAKRVIVAGPVHPDIAKLKSTVLNVNDDIHCHSAVFRSKVEFMSGVQWPDSILSKLVPVRSSKPLTVAVKSLATADFKNSVTVKGTINEIDIEDMVSQSACSFSNRRITTPLTFMDKLITHSIDVPIVLTNDYSYISNATGVALTIYKDAALGSVFSDEVYVAGNLSNVNLADFFNNTLLLGVEQYVFGHKTVNGNLHVAGNRKLGDNFKVTEQIIIGGRSLQLLFQDAVLSDGALSIVNSEVEFTSSVKVQQLLTDYIDGIKMHTLFFNSLLINEDRHLILRGNLRANAINSAVINHVNIDQFLANAAVFGHLQSPVLIKFNKVFVKNNLIITGTINGIRTSEIVSVKSKSVVFRNSKWFSGHVHVCGEFSTKRGMVAKSTSVGESLVVDRLIVDGNLHVNHILDGISWKRFIDNVIFLSSEKSLNFSNNLLFKDITIENDFTINGYFNGLNVTNLMANMVTIDRPVSISGNIVFTNKTLFMKSLSLKNSNMVNLRKMLGHKRVSSGTIKFVGPVTIKGGLYAQLIKDSKFKIKHLKLNILQLGGLLMGINISKWDKEAAKLDMPIKFKDGVKKFDSIEIANRANCKVFYTNIGEYFRNLSLCKNNIDLLKFGNVHFHGDVFVKYYLETMNNEICLKFNHKSFDKLEADYTKLKLKYVQPSITTESNEYFKKRYSPAIYRLISVPYSTSFGQGRRTYAELPTKGQSARSTISTLSFSRTPLQQSFKKTPITLGYILSTRNKSAEKTPSPIIPTIFSEQTSYVTLTPTIDTDITSLYTAGNITILKKSDGAEFEDPTYLTTLSTVVDDDIWNTISTEFEISNNFTSSFNTFSTLAKGIASTVTEIEPEISATVSLTELDATTVMSQIKTDVTTSVTQPDADVISTMAETKTVTPEIMTSEIEQTSTMVTSELEAIAMIADTVALKSSETGIETSFSTVSDFVETITPTETEGTTEGEIDTLVFTAITSNISYSNVTTTTGDKIVEDKAIANITGKPISSAATFLPSKETFINESYVSTATEKVISNATFWASAATDEIREGPTYLSQPFSAVEIAYSTAMEVITEAITKSEEISATSRIDIDVNTTSSDIAATETDITTISSPKSDFGTQTDTTESNATLTLFSVTEVAPTKLITAEPTVTLQPTETEFVTTDTEISSTAEFLFTTSETDASQSTSTESLLSVTSDETEISRTSVDSDVSETSTGTDISEASIGTEFSETSIRTEFSETSIRTEASETSIEIETSGASFGTATSETSIKTGTSETSIKTGTSETSIKTGTSETSIKTGTSETLIKTGTSETSIKTGTSETSIKTETSAASFRTTISEKSIETEASGTSFGTASTETSIGTEVTSSSETEVTASLKTEVTSSSETEVTASLETEVTASLETEVTASLETEVTASLETVVTTELSETEVTATSEVTEVPATSKTTDVHVTEVSITAVTEKASLITSPEDISTLTPMETEYYFDDRSTISESVLPGELDVDTVSSLLTTLNVSYTNVTSTTSGVIIEDKAVGNVTQKPVSHKEPVKNETYTLFTIEEEITPEVSTVSYSTVIDKLTHSSGTAVSEVPHLASTFAVGTETADLIYSTEAAHISDAPYLTYGTTEVGLEEISASVSTEDSAEAPSTERDVSATVSPIYLDAAATIQTVSEVPESTTIAIPSTVEDISKPLTRATEPVSTETERITAYTEEEVTIVVTETTKSDYTDIETITITDVGESGSPAKHDISTTPLTEADTVITFITAQTTETESEVLPAEVVTETEPYITAVRTATETEVTSTSITTETIAEVAASESEITEIVTTTKEDVTLTSTAIITETTAEVAAVTVTSVPSLMLSIEEDGISTFLSSERDVTATSTVSEMLETTATTTSEQSTSVVSTTVAEMTATTTHFDDFVKEKTSTDISAVETTTEGNVETTTLQFEPLDYSRTTESAHGKTESSEESIASSDDWTTDFISSLKTDFEAHTDAPFVVTTANLTNATAVDEVIVEDKVVGKTNKSTTITTPAHSIKPYKNYSRLEITEDDELFPTVSVIGLTTSVPFWNGVSENETMSTEVSGEIDTEKTTLGFSTVSDLTLTSVTGDDATKLTSKLSLEDLKTLSTITGEDSFTSLDIDASTLSTIAEEESSTSLDVEASSPEFVKQKTIEITVSDIDVTATDSFYKSESTLHDVSAETPKSISSLLTGEIRELTTETTDATVSTITEITMIATHSDDFVKEMTSADTRDVETTTEDFTSQFELFDYSRTAFTEVVSDVATIEITESAHGKTDYSEESIAPSEDWTLTTDFISSSKTDFEAHTDAPFVVTTANLTNATAVVEVIVEDKSVGKTNKSTTITTPAQSIKPYKNYSRLEITEDDELFPTVSVIGLTTSVPFWTGAEDETISTKVSGDDATKLTSKLSLEDLKTPSTITGEDSFTSLDIDASTLAYVTQKTNETEVTSIDVTDSFYMPESTLQEVSTETSKSTSALLTREMQELTTETADAAALISDVTAATESVGMPQFSEEESSESSRSSTSTLSQSTVELKFTETVTEVHKIDRISESTESDAYEAPTKDLEILISSDTQQPVTATTMLDEDFTEVPTIQIDSSTFKIPSDYTVTETSSWRTSDLTIGEASTERTVEKSVTLTESLSTTSAEYSTSARTAESDFTYAEGHSIDDAMSTDRSTQAVLSTDVSKIFRDFTITSEVDMEMTVSPATTSANVSYAKVTTTTSDEIIEDKVVGNATRKPTTIASTSASSIYGIIKNESAIISTTAEEILQETSTVYLSTDAKTEETAIASEDFDGVSISTLETKPSEPFSASTVSFSVESETTAEETLFQTQETVLHHEDISAIPLTDADSTAFTSLISEVTIVSRTDVTDATQPAETISDIDVTSETRRTETQATITLAQTTPETSVAMETEMSTFIPIEMEDKILYTSTEFISRASTMLTEAEITDASIEASIIVKTSTETTDTASTKSEIAATASTETEFTAAVSTETDFTTMTVNVTQTVKIDNETVIPVTTTNISAKTSTTIGEIIKEKAIGILTPKPTNVTSMSPTNESTSEISTIYLTTEADLDTESTDNFSSTRETALTDLSTDSDTSQIAVSFKSTTDYLSSDAEFISASTSLETLTVDAVKTETLLRTFTAETPVSIIKDEITGWEKSDTTLHFDDATSTTETDSIPFASNITLTTDTSVSKSTFDDIISLFASLSLTDATSHKLIDGVTETKSATTTSRTDFTEDTSFTTVVTEELTPTTDAVTTETPSSVTSEARLDEETITSASTADMPSTAVVDSTIKTAVDYVVSLFTTMSLTDSTIQESPDVTVATESTDTTEVADSSELKAEIETNVPTASTTKNPITNATTVGDIVEENAVGSGTNKSTIATTSVSPKEFYTNASSLSTKGDLVVTLARRLTTETDQLVIVGKPSTESVVDSTSQDISSDHSTEESNATVTASDSSLSDVTDFSDTLSDSGYSAHSYSTETETTSSDSEYESITNLSIEPFETSTGPETLTGEASANDLSNPSQLSTISDESLLTNISSLTELSDLATFETPTTLKELEVFNMTLDSTALNASASSASGSTETIDELFESSLETTSTDLEVEKSLTSKLFSIGISSQTDSFSDETQKDADTTPAASNEYTTSYPSSLFDEESGFYLPDFSSILPDDSEGTTTVDWPFYDFLTKTSNYFDGLFSRTAEEAEPSVVSLNESTYVEISSTGSINSSTAQSTISISAEESATEASKAASDATETVTLVTTTTATNTEMDEELVERFSSTDLASISTEASAVTSSLFPEELKIQPAIIITVTDSESDEEFFSFSIADTTRIMNPATSNKYLTITDETTLTDFNGSDENNAAQDIFGKSTPETDSALNGESLTFTVNSARGHLLGSNDTDSNGTPATGNEVISDRVVKLPTNKSVTAVILPESSKEPCANISDMKCQMMTVDEDQLPSKMSTLQTPPFLEAVLWTKNTDNASSTRSEVEDDTNVFKIATTIIAETKTGYLNKKHPFLNDDLESSSGSVEIMNVNEAKLNSTVARGLSGVVQKIVSNDSNVVNAAVDNSTSRVVKPAINKTESPIVEPTVDTYMNINREDDKEFSTVTTDEEEAVTEAVEEYSTLWSTTEDY